MVTDRDTTRIVRSWLEDGRTSLPDHVLDAVLDQLPATSQRRSWWPTRRIADMNALTKFAAAAAAVVLVAVVGISLIPGVGPVGGPGPTVAPTPSATPLPSATPSTPPLSVGPLTSGRYAWEWPTGRATFEVPDGWIGHEPDRVVRHIDAPSYIEIMPWFPGTTSGVDQVYSDSCASGETLVPIGPTTAELVAALEAQGGMDATVTELEIGGRPATRVDLAVEPGLDTSTCRHADEGPFAPLQIWFLNEAAGYFALAPATDGSYGKAVIWSVDVDGGPLVFTTALSIDTDPADFAAVEAMVASIEFE